MLEKLWSAKIFTNVDFQDIYDYVGSKKRNTKKIVFRLQYKYYKFIIILIVLVDILIKQFNITYIIYFNNIIMFNNNKRNYKNL